jgi:hypothetical protein
MIDDRDVSGFLSGFLSFLKRSFLYVLFSVRRFFILSLAVFLVVSGAALFYRYQQKPYYESELVCAFNNLSKKTYGEMVHKLDILARSGSTTTLSNTLKLSQAQAASILGIEAKNMSGSPLYEDTSSNRTPMYFQVRATDREVFAPLQIALVNYLNSASPYRQLRNDMELEATNKKIQYLNRDMQQVDTVVQAYRGYLGKAQPLKNGSPGLSSVPDLMSYKNKLEDRVIQQEWRSRELRQSVEVLNGFLAPDHPSKGNAMPFWMIFITALAASMAAAVLGRLLAEAGSPQKQPA